MNAPSSAILLNYGKTFKRIGEKGGPAPPAYAKSGRFCEQSRPRAERVKLGQGRGRFQYCVDTEDSISLCLRRSGIPAEASSSLSKLNFTLSSHATVRWRRSAITRMRPGMSRSLDHSPGRNLGAPAGFGIYIRHVKTLTLKDLDLGLKISLSTTVGGCKIERGNAS
jgi:hypothetical protein